MGSDKATLHPEKILVSLRCHYSSFFLYLERSQGSWDMLQVGLSQDATILSIVHSQQLLAGGTVHKFKLYAYWSSQVGSMTKLWPSGSVLTMPDGMYCAFFTLCARTLANAAGTLGPLIT